MPDLKPLNDFVIIQPLDDQQQTESGLFIPEPKDKHHQKGTVVSIGPGELQNGTRHPIEGVSVGDTVLYDELSADPIPHNGQNVAVAKQSALILVISK